MAFAFKPQTEAIARVLLSVVILFNALAPTAASASSVSGQEQSADFSSGNVLHADGASQHSTGARPSRASTALTAADDQNETDSETELAPSPEVKTPSLSLTADPDYLTPNTTLTLTWTIEGLTLQDHPGLQLQITIPEGLSLQPGYEGSYDEVTRILTLTPTALSGQVNVTSGATIQEVEVRSFLSENTQAVADSLLFLPTHEQYLTQVAT